MNQTQIRASLTITALAIIQVVETVLEVIRYNIHRATLIRVFMEQLEEFNNQ
jgi:hypothetical protein